MNKYKMALLAIKKFILRRRKKQTIKSRIDIFLKEGNPNGKQEEEIDALPLLSSIYPHIHQFTTHILLICTLNIKITVSSTINIIIF